MRKVVILKLKTMIEKGCKYKEFEMKEEALDDGISVTATQGAAGHALSKAP